MAELREVFAVPQPELDEHMANIFTSVLFLKFGHTHTHPAGVCFYWRSGDPGLLSAFYVSQTPPVGYMCTELRLWYIGLPFT